MRLTQKLQQKLGLSIYIRFFLQEKYFEVI